jgi:hypothetical protein
MTYAPSAPRTSCHRNIVAVDIEGSTSRTDPIKADLRHVLYELLEQALYAGGLIAAYRDPLIDRGDGVLTLLHPVDQVPTRTLLDTVIPSLGTLLGEHNVCHPAQRFRLRAVVHAGEVHYDRRGCFGEALDVAFRLLNAQKVKKSLRVSSAPLVLVVSDDIYRSVVRHDYDGIDAHAFDTLVRPSVGGRRYRGWIRSVETATVVNLASLGDDQVIRMGAYANQAG